MSSMASKHATKKQKVSSKQKKKAVATTARPNIIPDPFAIENDSDKDDEERTLEEALFGKPFTPRGFKNAAKGKQVDRLAIVSDQPSLDHVLDDELFFFDDPSGVHGGNISQEQRALSEDSGLGEDAAETVELTAVQNSGAPSANIFQRTSRKGPAWVDPSDSQIQVSLASDTRLRKLRDTIDEDEVSGRQYEAKLRRQFERINPTPSWAQNARNKLHGTGKRRRRSSDSSSSTSTDGVQETKPSKPDQTVDDLFNSTGGILSADRPTSLPPANIQIERLRDANQAAPSEGEVLAVRFHPSPTVPVMLTTGKDRRLRLFNIDGLTNPLLHTVHVPSLPLNSASFHPSGSSILLTGTRPFYFTYDLQSGVVQQSPRGLWSSTSINGTALSDGDRSMETCRFSDDGKLVAIAGRRGYVHLLDWSSGAGQIIGSVKMNGAVRDLAWNGSEKKELMTMSEQGEMYIWDVGSRRCRRRWKDNGAFGATVLARGGQGNYFAIGSSTGIVNVYDGDAGSSSLGSNQVSLKAITNLTTPISSIRFDPSAQIMAIASDSKKDSLRMVHLPSLTTFANWPTSGTPLGRVTSLDFSPGSEYVGIGNHKGRVLLYNLKHFGTR